MFSKWILSSLSLNIDLLDVWGKEIKVFREHTSKYLSTYLGEKYLIGFYLPSLVALFFPLKTLSWCSHYNLIPHLSVQPSWGLGKNSLNNLNIWSFFIKIKYTRNKYLSKKNSCVRHWGFIQIKICTWLKIISEFYLCHKALNQVYLISTLKKSLLR